MNKLSVVPVLTLFAALVLSACQSGGGGLQNSIAQQFLGSAPVSVSGPDADNEAAVNASEDMVTGRRFDLTPSGFTIASGNVNSTAAAGSDFGVAGGTLDVSGDTATVGLDVFSTNPDITNAHMDGTFSLSDATQAMTHPGESFMVDWHITFDYVGIPISLDVQQQLTGSDFVNQGGS